MINNSFGQSIRNIRKNKGMTLRQVADFGNLSYSFLSLVEQGKRPVPKITTLKKIATGLRIPESRILELAGITPVTNTDITPSNAIPIKPDNNSVSIPIYGRISAGYPEGAVEDIEGNIGINSDLVTKYGTDNLLALRIDGESMNKIAPNGSIAILAKLDTSELKNGDVCGVIINGDSATIKHVYRYPDHIRFEPDSWLSDFKAYEYKTADVENNEPPIQFIGKLVQIINVFDK